jgi:hypothetical protein
MQAFRRSTIVVGCPVSDGAVAKRRWWDRPSGE